MATRPMTAAPTTPRPASRLSEFFAIDLRSLAVFRIGLGFLLLLDLYGRAQTLRMHYTGEGCYPRELALELVQPDLALFHVFLLSDRVEVQALLFGVFALLALLFVLGWHTRVVSVLVFVLLVSLVRRNHWACHTGDGWLETLFFWAMFLPLGARFSLDRLHGRAPPTRGPSGLPTPTELSIATAGVLIQIAIFYVMAGYLKSRYDVWTRGEAVWVFTHVIEYTRPFGAWLGQYPRACSLLTLGTLVVEGLGPFFLFVPFWTARLRTVLVLVLACFHLTLQATIHIGIFQMICITSLALYLPSSTWDGLVRRVPASWRARWEVLASAFVRRFGVTGPVAPRAAFARASSLATGALLVPVLAVILVSNVNSAVRNPYDKGDRGPLPLPLWLEQYGRMFCVVQSWNMFTDIDRAFFGWFLVLGQQEDGQLVDVLEGRPAGALRPPEHYARAFPNHNSRRYWREMARPEREDLQKAMCDYLAREWRREGRTPLTHLAVYHVGRIPSRRPGADEVKPICWQWEAPHEPLRSAAPAVGELWTERRARWQGILQGVPKSLPAAR
ncbi:MAG: HTTM domain-containing protein [Planctomycetes bacterium]|nr:HTTM domain-containing protein [Planctomycetota bacterium]